MAGVAVILKNPRCHSPRRHSPASELVGRDVDDLSVTADGLVIRVSRSKIDPEAKGTTVALPYGSTAATCPVRSYRAWLAPAGIVSGPAFRAIDRHGRVGQGRMNAASMARLIKRSAEAAGLDPHSYAATASAPGLRRRRF